MTGTLVSTPIGVLKRGTHILRKDGDDLAIVESPTVNLRAYEGQDVGLRGTFEQNSDPSLQPVLVVTEITPVVRDMQNLLIPSLKISCQAPQSWQMKTTNGVTSFAISNAPDPIITLAFDPTVTQIPTGSPFLIDGKHGTRTTDISSAYEKVTVDLGASFLVMRFMPGSPEEAENIRPAWLTFLSSIRFQSSDSSSSRVISGSGSGIPCGGTAGILCPTGEYCAITDFKENIGRCKR